MLDHNRNSKFEKGDAPVSIYFLPQFLREEKTILYKKIRGGVIVMSLKFIILRINKPTECEDHFYVVYNDTK